MSACVRENSLFVWKRLFMRAGVDAYTSVRVRARGERGVGVATLLHSTVTEHYA